MTIRRPDKWHLRALLSLLVLADCGTGTPSVDDGQPPRSTGSPAARLDKAVITVDSSLSFQTITGWETTAQAGQLDPAFPLFREELFDRAVNELGLNRVRLEVRSGAENGTDWSEAFRARRIDDKTWRCQRYATQNDNGDPSTIHWAGFQFSELDSAVEEVVIPLKQLVAANGERLLINVTYVAFTDQICGDGEYHHDSPEEYAEFVLAVHLHLRDKYGIVPDSWEVILEPDNTDYWRGRQIGLAMVKAAERLRSNGFGALFVSPSTAHMGRAVTYFDDLVQISGASELLGEFSYHRYGGVSNANLGSIAARSMEHAVNPAMLEHIGSDYEDLHDDLKLAGVSAWQQFALAFRASDNGAQYFVIDADERGDPVVRMGSRTKFLRQYFRHVRRGARRMEATSQDSNLDPLAFVNTDGRFVVVIKARAGRRFTIGGLPPGSYGLSHTTGDEYGAEGVGQTINAGDVVTATMPGRGVLTVYGIGRG